MALWGFRPEHTPAQNIEFYLSVEQAENDEREQLLNQIIVIEHQLHNLVVAEYGKLKEKGMVIGEDNFHFFITYTQEMIALLNKEKRLLSRLSRLNSKEINRERGAYRVIITGDRKKRFEQLRKFKRIK